MVRKAQVVGNLHYMQSGMPGSLQLQVLRLLCVAVALQPCGFCQSHETCKRRVLCAANYSAANLQGGGPDCLDSTLY